MKEITKDYVCQYELSKFDEDLKIDERAEKYNKKFYKEIVAKEKSRYADLEKTERKELKKAYKRYYKERKEMVSWLPKDNLKEVADRRVLIYGYVSERVYKKIKGYCEKLRKIEESFQREADKIKLPPFEEMYAKFEKRIKEEI